MKQSFEKWLLLPLIFLTFFSHAAAPTYKIRSQSRDKTRQLVGTEALYAHRINEEKSGWGFFSITPGYTQSFKDNDICSCLFGGALINTPNNNCNSSCDCCSIAIQGGLVPDRSSSAWWADYFYLPLNFSSTLSFSPNIRNFILDFDLYVGLDDWLEGAYFRMYGPFVHSRWNLDFCETIITPGTTGYPQGYMAPDAVSAANLLESFAAYAAGNSPETITTTETNSTIINTFLPLRFAKMSRCARSENGFADLRVELGWNFWNEERYHVGVNLQAAAPTGPKMRAAYLFNPQVGNGHHWELGGGLSAHYVFWRSENENKKVGVYLDVNITHIFSAQEQRTFDLKCKPMSRYMLATQYGPNTQVLRGEPSTTLATKQFTGTFSPVANLSTFMIDVSVAAQADVVALLNYQSGNWSFDLGYNFWAQSCEDIHCPDDCSSCNDSCPTLCDATQMNTWALKGDARLYGFTQAGSVIPPLLAAGEAVPLSATNSTATIFAGTVGNDLASSGTGSDNNTPDGTIDNPQLADAGGSISNLTVVPVIPIRIYTSIQPVFLSCEDIDFKGVRGRSNKLFTHVSYTFEHENWQPFLGLGAFGEFGRSDCNSSCSCTEGCTSCVDCALSQWGIWVKGGITFN